MHKESFRHTRPGIIEAEIAAVIQRVALAEGREQSYNPIVTVHGEVLHNHDHHHELRAGQLLLNDSGAESALYYASDITRTAPVSGKFTPKQKAIYEVVLEAQLRAIAKVQPGVTNKDIHLEASRAIAEGLIDLGLMRGNAEDAVTAGAHALFFPHGIGHMLGLDVHDMEDLGDLVGYGEGKVRDTQFGLNFLRLARPLEEGFVITIEPGIYFIGALMDRFFADGQYTQFLNADAFDGYRDFGGIRIEDDVLCTTTGSRVLVPQFPKTVEEVERRWRVECDAEA
jgi:Xaa-Pro aminopeptidase